MAWGVASRSDAIRYAACGLVGIFVFPYADHDPADLFETSVGVGVSVLVARDLAVPKFGGRAGRWTVVLVASVPEAAVEEDGDLLFCEHEVRCVANGLDWADVDAVAEAEAVDRGSKRLFGGVCHVLGSLASPHASSRSKPRNRPWCSLTSERRREQTSLTHDSPRLAQILVACVVLDFPYIPFAGLAADRPTQIGVDPSSLA